MLHALFYDGVRKTGCAGYLIEILDDTRQQTQIHELNAMAKKAEEANLAKGAFLASISHEIRTPINAVLGMNEMILRESEEPQIRVYAGNIKKAGNSLLSLINNVLDYSRMEHGATRDPAGLLRRGETVM